MQDVSRYLDIVQAHELINISDDTGLSAGAERRQKRPFLTHTHTHTHTHTRESWRHGSREGL